MENSKPEIPSREFPVFLWLRLRLTQDQVRSDVAEGGVKIQSTNTKRPKATKQAKRPNGRSPFKRPQGTKRAKRTYQPPPPPPPPPPPENPPPPLPLEDFG